VQKKLSQPKRALLTARSLRGRLCHEGINETEVESL